jgi:hypothetical protein
MPVYRPNVALAPLAYRAPASVSASTPSRKGHWVHFQSLVSVAGASAHAVAAASTTVGLKPNHTKKEGREFNVMVRFAYRINARPDG